MLKELKCSHVVWAAVGSVHSTACDDLANGLKVGVQADRPVLSTDLYVVSAPCW